MGTYEWVSGQVAGESDGGDNPDLVWHTPFGLAVRTLSVPSPVGEGDVLVRTEVSVSIRAFFAKVGLASQFPQKSYTQFIGDVGIHDGETIDPSVSGPGGFAFTWDRLWNWQDVGYGSATLDSPMAMSLDSVGYVTSKARRGPESYGAIDPAFNLSCLTHGSSYYITGLAGVGSSWVITARCLWFTP